MMGISWCMKKKKKQSNTNFEKKITLPSGEDIITDDDVQKIWNSTSNLDLHQSIIRVHKCDIRWFDLATVNNKPNKKSKKALEKAAMDMGKNTIKDI